MITSLANRFLKTRNYFLLSILVNFNVYNWTFAMQKGRVVKETCSPSYLSSSLNWIASSIANLLSKNEKLGFTVPYPCPRKSAIFEELLDEVLRGERDMNVTIELDYSQYSLAYQVRLRGTAATLAYFIAHGATWNDSWVGLSRAMPLFDHHKLQKIEKLKVLMKAGFDPNDNPAGHVELYNTFCGSHDYFSIRNYENLDYLCAYATVLLKAGADPNFLPDPKRHPDAVRGTPFCLLLQIIAGLKCPCYKTDTPYPQAKEKSIIKTFLQYWADYNKIDYETRNELETKKPYLEVLIASFETEKCALFAAIDEQNFEKIKALAQRVSFRVKNAAGDTPLHHAVRKLKGKTDNKFTVLDAEAQNSKHIIFLLLLILPELAAFKNSSGEIPILLIFPINKFWMLKECFIPAANPQALNH